MNTDTNKNTLITLVVLTASTQIGTTLIHKMAKHPAILFMMGAGVGIYSYKNRSQILAEAHYLKQQGKKILTRKTEKTS